MTADLVAFLRARLVERAAKARAATPGRWVANKHEYGAEVYTEAGEGVAYDHDAGGVSWDDADFIADHDPARVLAEVEAKRRIVAGIADADAEAAYIIGTFTAWDVLRLLALPYADHADYREEWRP